jgi:hypothetical protein
MKVDEVDTAEAQHPAEIDRPSPGPPSPPATTPWYRRLTQSAGAARLVRRFGSSHPAGVLKESAMAQTTPAPLMVLPFVTSRSVSQAPEAGSVPTSAERRGARGRAEHC